MDKEKEMTEYLSKAAELFLDAEFMYHLAVMCSAMKRKLVKTMDGPDFSKADPASQEATRNVVRTCDKVEELWKHLESVARR